MGISLHDAYKEIASQNVAYATSGGTSAQSAAFGAQTYWIRIVAVGVISATNDGVRYTVGTNPTAAATSKLLPLNWVENVAVTPGQKLAALSNNNSTGSLSITELS